MPSLGELFVSLGFDVDDKKLKDFNQALNSTLDTMLKIAGVTVSLDAFKGIITGASNSAAKLKQMSSELGINAEAIQRWSLAANQLNPNTSVEGFQANYKKFASILKQQVVVGEGPTGALAQLGVTRLDANTDIEDARKQISDFKAEWFRRNPGQQGYYARLLDEAGLGGASMNIQGVSEEKIDQMTRGLIVQKEAIDNMDSLAKKTALLGQAFDKLKADMANKSSGQVSDFVTGWTAILEAIDQGSMEPIYKANSKPNQLDIWARQGVAGVNGVLEEGSAENRKSRAQRYFESKGWSGDDAAAITRRLFDESGLKSGIYSQLEGERQGDAGEAYGIAQWHPARQREFMRHTGHSIKESTSAEQLEFVNYELTEGMYRRAGEKLKSTSDYDEKYNVMKYDYEGAAGKPRVNIVQNIHSNQPLKNTLDDAARSNREQYDTAYTTMNNGAVR